MASTTAPASAQPIPFILDTDTAADDCVAMLIGLLDPAADLVAVTMVAGNVGFDRQLENAWMTLSAAGRLGTVPVFEGARRPLLREWASAEDVHGDGAGGLSMDFDGLVPETEYGPDALVRLVAERPGELSIVAIGPLTNIALAVVKDPTFAANVKTLVIMGGSNNGRGNITAAAEYNFYVDPEAAQTVFTAGFADILVLPWDPVTLVDGLLSEDEFHALGALGTPVSDYFGVIGLATLDFDKRVGIPGSTHPDSMSVAVLLHPELISDASAYRVDIETASELTRGYSAMSWLGTNPPRGVRHALADAEEPTVTIHGMTPNATVVESVDAAGFHDLLRGILATETTPTRPIRR